MMIENRFFIIFFVTIAVTRAFLFLFPISSPTIGKFRVHHYMYGILGILIGLLFQSLIVYAVGFGLFVDELTFLLMGGKTHEDNYSRISLFGTLFFVVLVFILRGYLTLTF